MGKGGSRKRKTQGITTSKEERLDCAMLKESTSTQLSIFKRMILCLYSEEGIRSRRLVEGIRKLIDILPFTTLILPSQNKMYESRDI